jgi:hypothetical protein
MCFILLLCSIFYVIYLFRSFRLFQSPIRLLYALLPLILSFCVQLGRSVLAVRSFSSFFGSIDNLAIYIPDLLLFCMK